MKVQHNERYCDENIQQNYCCEDLEYRMNFLLKTAWGLLQCCLTPGRSACEELHKMMADYFILKLD